MSNIFVATFKYIRLTISLKKKHTQNISIFNVYMYVFNFTRITIASSWKDKNRNKNSNSSNASRIFTITQQSFQRKSVFHKTIIKH